VELLSSYSHGNKQNNNPEQEQEECCRVPTEPFLLLDVAKIHYTFEQHEKI